MTGKCPAANPAVDQAMGRNLAQARIEVGKANEGRATLAQVRDASGNLTKVMESVPEGGANAEPQVMPEPTPAEIEALQCLPIDRRYG